MTISTDFEVDISNLPLRFMIALVADLAEARPRGSSCRRSDARPTLDAPAASQAKPLVAGVKRESRVAIALITRRLLVRTRIRGRNKGNDYYLPKKCRKIKGSGGEGGIRTHGTLAGTTVFETAPFDHSGTSPREWVQGLSKKPQRTASEQKGELAPGWHPRLYRLGCIAASIAAAASSSLLWNRWA